METEFELLVNAVDKALETVEKTLALLNDLDFIQPALADFDKEVIPYLEEIQDCLVDVEDAADEDELDELEVLVLQAEVLEDLYDEVDRFDEIFSSIEDIPEAATDLLGGELPSEVEDGFYRFIETRLKPVRTALCEVHRIISESASVDWS